MKINVICVGRLKEAYWTMAVEEYKKRIGRYSRIELLEVSDERSPERLSLAEEEIVKKREGERIRKLIKEDAYVVALAIEGRKLNSEGFSSFLGTVLEQKSSVVFIIGGSLGLSKEVMKRADCALSFSDMTFPHQLMRVILLEQIYRGFRILKNEPYHK